MYAIATFVVVGIISLIFTRLATGALIATGVPPEVASFQARSAFTGAGFTTTEAENVVNHRVRRRIVATTMLVGNLGTPTLVVSVLLGFLAPGPGDTTDRLLAAAAGLAVVAVVLGSPPVRRRVVALGQRYAARRLMPELGTEHEELLDLGGGFEVWAVPLQGAPDRAPRSLRELDQALAGVRLLGVRRVADGTFVGAPPIDLELTVGDALVLSGSREALLGLAASGGPSS